MEELSCYFRIFDIEFFNCYFYLFIIFICLYCFLFRKRGCLYFCVEKFRRGMLIGKKRILSCMNKFKIVNKVVFSEDSFRLGFSIEKG